MSYWRLFYHLVWATRGRAPFLNAERWELIDRAVRAACHDHGVQIHAVAAMPDHVHLVASIPPRIATADLMHRVKGMSSHLVNERWPPRDGEAPFAWQAEYGVFSFAERSLPSVVAYVHDQPAHHATGATRPQFEAYASTPPPRPSPGGAS